MMTPEEELTFKLANIEHNAAVESFLLHMEIVKSLVPAITKNGGILYEMEQKHGIKRIPHVEISKI